MRVDDSFSASSDLRSLQIERTPETQTGPPSRSGRLDRTGDSASLSALGADISRALAEDSPQEITRVERAQEAVAAGGLNDSSSEIADALIDDALFGTSFERQADSG